MMPILNCPDTDKTINRYVSCIIIALKFTDMTNKSRLCYNTKRKMVTIQGEIIPI
jgi:hypothetical protein